MGGPAPCPRRRGAAGYQSEKYIPVPKFPLKYMARPPRHPRTRSEPLPFSRLWRVPSSSPSPIVKITGARYERPPACRCSPHFLTTKSTKDTKGVAAWPSCTVATRCPHVIRSLCSLCAQWCQSFFVLFVCFVVKSVRCISVRTVRITRGCKPRRTSGLFCNQSFLLVPQASHSSDYDHANSNHVRDLVDPLRQIRCVIDGLSKRNSRTGHLDHDNGVVCVENRDQDRTTDYECKRN